MMFLAMADGDTPATDVIVDKVQALEPVLLDMATVGLAIAVMLFAVKFGWFLLRRIAWEGDGGSYYYAGEDWEEEDYYQAHRFSDETNAEREERYAAGGRD